MLIFGGKNEYRQISEVTKHRVGNHEDACVLKRIGDLPFDFTMGACTESFNELFLCFDSQTPYACYRLVYPSQDYFLIIAPLKRIKPKSIEAILYLV